MEELPIISERREIQSGGKKFALGSVLGEKARGYEEISKLGRKSTERIGMSPSHNILLLRDGAKLRRPCAAR
jgi:hypothetical protein